MFAFGKMVSFLTHPLCWVAIVLLVGLLVQAWSKRAQAGRRWFVSAFLLLLFLGWELPPTWLVSTLEKQYPKLIGRPVQAVGMVVLGGATDGGKLTGPSMPVPLGDAAERLTEAMVLAKDHPNWIIVFSGGLGNDLDEQMGQWSEGRMALELWRRQGLPTQNVLLEEQSRNTAENAKYSALLPNIDQKQRWLLVTSAWHMPRSVLAFESTGWNVQPYPVDFRGNPQTQWTDYSFKRGVSLWHVGIREYVGLAALKWQLR
jgi:uncharacterized SAM-binding protein YcdF (DUF218 family)